MSRRVRRSERGAVAVITAVFLVVMVGLSAFVVDLGMAYANKRQAQTAADAAALGAAVVYGQQPASSGCEGLRAAGDDEANAQAVEKVGQNDDTMIDDRPGELTDWQTECTDNGLEISVEVSTTSPNVFGRSAGKEGDYDVARTAKAVVSAATSVGGDLRPLALCSRDLLPLTVFPTPVMKFEGPSSGPTAPEDSDCPRADPAGNWWTLDCPSQNGALADEIRNGCANPVSIVPGQPAPDDAGLSSHLLGHCPTVGADPAACLGGDPGMLRDSPSKAALQSLIDSGETVYFPVFCGTTACDPPAIHADGGDNSIFPVFRIVAARLCGYHLGNGAGGYYQTSDGDCGSSSFDASVGGPHRNYLLLSIQSTNVSSPITSAECNIGDPCDTGLREVRMTG